MSDGGYGLWQDGSLWIGASWSWKLEQCNEKLPNQIVPMLIHHTVKEPMLPVSCARYILHFDFSMFPNPLANPDPAQ